MASSSSSSAAAASCVYDVFLSFRGEDTRYNFTSHLDSALRRKHLKFFIDEELERGDEISTTLLNAIETSKISVIIFSQNYASSRWCLDELVKILECQKMKVHIVIPVFYHVDPSHVRKQTGNFGDAFVELAKRFNKMPEKVQKWKDALTEASNISGWDSTNIRSEAELVDEIVNDILKKLKHTSISNDFEGFIGLHPRIEQIKSLLCMGMQDLRIVGIWGMGGIGKTTIAGAMFSQISNEFDCKSFMINVREEFEKGGLIHLRAQVLSKILEEDVKIGTPTLPGHIKERLQRIKIFIVLDDVNQPKQLESLFGGFSQLGPGSRIIVTTRDRQILEKCGADYIYEVERLTSHESNELFSNYAFRQDHFTKDLSALSESVRNYANGNPLALKVLGSFFYQKSKLDWEKALCNLHLISSSKIHDLLKISYDELNLEEQSIFLDTACFFNGEDKDHVLQILDSPCINYGLNVLIDKSLITESKSHKLQMHDLLQEMGREIVRQESIKYAGNRSRLWYHEDVYQVLKNDKGTDSIEGIFLDMSKVRDMDITSEVFKRMPNLRLLKFYMPNHFNSTDISSKVQLSQGLDYLSDELRYLHWYGFPLRTLPLNFNPERLIKLSLPYCKVEQLWDGRKEAFKLKSIDLHNSRNFTMIPNPSEAPNLETLYLSNCVKLPHIPSFIQNFSNLGLLCLKGCNNVRCFPRNIYFRSPIAIDLSFCVDLTEFSQISGKILELNLRGTAIEEVLPSIESLTDLEKLDLTFCERLKAVSTSICKLKSLRELALDYCLMLEGFPEILETMERLEYIGLKSTGIQELPSSIENAQGLQNLSLMDCSRLASLPENLGNLKSLKFLHGKRLAIRQLPSSITNLKRLEQLSLSGCRGLVLPSLSGLSSLKDLELDGCGIMNIPEDIGDLSSLERLNLMGNDFESLPIGIKNLCKLRELILRNCKNLQSLPELPLHPFHLDATNCEWLKDWQILPSRYSLWQTLDVSELEILTKHYGNKDVIGMELDFSNCHNLSKYDILEFPEEQMELMLNALLSQFYKKEIPKPYGFSICLPGSRIPEWFTLQVSGSSINIQQAQLCIDKKFIGFALCAVVAFNNALQANEDFAVVSRCRFHTKTLSETEHVDRQFVFKTIKNYSFGNDLTNYPAHIYLGFDPCSILGLSDAVSFDFFVDSGYKFQKGPEVKYCGVCPIYLHPIEINPCSFIVKYMFSIIGGISATSQLPSSIRCFENAKIHQFFGCKGLVLTSLVGVSYLIKLELDDCDTIKIPQDIGCLASLKTLNLAANNFESLPTSIKELYKLEELNLSSCNMLQSIPELPPRLKHLDASNCRQLQYLPELPSHLQELDAYILENFIKRRRLFCKYLSYCVVELNFTNCMNLNANTNKSILADLQLTIQHLVVAYLRNFYQGEFSQPHAFRICLPGSSIPDWFSNRSSRSSINFQLPQLSCRRRLIGFILCAVISFKEVLNPPKGNDLFVRCEYCFETKTFFKRKYVDRRFMLKDQRIEFDNELIYASDHVFLGFYPVVPDGDHVSFDFYVPSRQTIKLKCCGVCPIYAHPIETKPNTFTVNMAPISKEECRKLQNELNNEAIRSECVDIAELFGASQCRTTIEGCSSGRFDEEPPTSFLSKIFHYFGLDCNPL